MHAKLAPVLKCRLMHQCADVSQGPNLRIINIDFGGYILNVEVHTGHYEFQYGTHKTPESLGDAIYNYVNVGA